MDVASSGDLIDARTERLIPSSHPLFTFRLQDLMSMQTVGESKVHSASFDTRLIADVRRPHTLKKAGTIAGVGLHTGSQVNMRVVPAGPGTGILFCRTDLPGRPMISAHVSCVSETHRCTTIGSQRACVHTVEHVLSALTAMRVDNAVVELSEAEPPAAGGCALPFVELIAQAGLQEQSGRLPVMKLLEPVYYSKEGVHLVALPSDEYRISYTLDYPNAKALNSQYCSIAINPDTFQSALAPCRTFALYEELSALMDAGLIKGGSLDSAVVIKGDEVLSKGGLHFPNEMARHKVLDLVGDLSLMGVSFLAHVIAIRSGHSANVALAGKLYEYLTRGERHEQQ